MTGGDILTSACLSQNALGQASPSGQGLRALPAANGSFHFHQWLKIFSLVSYRRQTLVGQAVSNRRHLRLTIPSSKNLLPTLHFFLSSLLKIKSLSSSCTRCSRAAGMQYSDTFPRTHLAHLSSPSSSTLVPGSYCVPAK